MIKGHFVEIMGILAFETPFSMIKGHFVEIMRICAFETPIFHDKGSFCGNNGDFSF